MRGVVKLLAAVAVIGAGVGLWITAPDRVDPERFTTLTGDAARGETIFTAAGCAS
jgi:hypothetical protein